MVFGMFNKKKEGDELEASVSGDMGLPDEQREIIERDVTMLENDSSAKSQKLQKAAEKTVINAAEDSIKKMHVIKSGHCPVCGEYLFQHMSASICNACGWHKYDMPRTGSVKVHLHSGAIVEGSNAYVLKSGECLVVSDDVVKATVPANALDWVEYIWPQEEIEQRRMQVASRMKIICGWCGQETDPSKDGFHLVHAAFGSSQERYVFCSDECYDAFRNMYPARVHRDCYERKCSECNLCLKRYSEDAREMRSLAKDYIRVKKGMI